MKLTELYSLNEAARPLTLSRSEASELVQRLEELEGGWPNTLDASYDVEGELSKLLSIRRRLMQIDSDNQLSSQDVDALWMWAYAVMSRDPRRDQSPLLHKIVDAANHEGDELDLNSVQNEATLKVPDTAIAPLRKLFQYASQKGLLPPEASSWLNHDYDIDNVMASYGKPEAPPSTALAINQPKSAVAKVKKGPTAKSRKVGTP